ncbi:hypothetical protein AVEN_47454-1 [Araneus ventricosus]|uniref:DUF19 domain-containing protein n=1 Tax=Araneus ventricosus TaxID=182803 RepID=A0A4Y2ISS5_ARAVE|nr:hypothetical protein AVEN_47454-1 [Araneus ventricosus]
MNFGRKTLLIAWVCILFVSLLDFTLTTDLGDGSLKYEEFDMCYRYINCDSGDEGFAEVLKCYEHLTDEDFAIAENFTKEAAILAGHPFHSTGLVPLRNEYCAFTDDQKAGIFQHITGLLIDAFTAICSSFKTRKQCDHFEKYLDCGFSLMEKYAALGICSVPDR